MGGESGTKEGDCEKRTKVRVVGEERKKWQSSLSFSPRPAARRRYSTEANRRRRTKFFLFYFRAHTGIGRREGNVCVCVQYYRRATAKTLSAMSIESSESRGGESFFFLRRQTSGRGRRCVKSWPGLGGGVGKAATTCWNYSFAWTVGRGITRSDRERDFCRKGGEIRVRHRKITEQTTALDTSYLLR